LSGRGGTEVKIAIDISPLATRKRTGIPNYIFNLCQNLPIADENNKYLLFGASFGYYQSLQAATKEMRINKHPNVSTRISRVPRAALRLIWKYMHVPSAERLVGDIDIFHASHRIPPPSKKARLVVTIHDLTPIKLPVYHTKKMIDHYISDIPQSLKKADMVIAVSNCTKNDILEHFDIAEERVRVTPEAANDNYKQISDKHAIDKVKGIYDIDKDYILFVGTLEPRKNLVNLLKAYSILPDYLKRDYALVLCGKKGWYYEEIFETVRELKLENKVIFTGYVPDKDIPLLMNGAAVFVYPSFYEGFGLPPLEAMACGTPVISTNVSSIPEVVGDAGILVSPTDVEELSDAMLRVLDNETLKAQLSEKGLKQASKFSWRATAEKTVELYNEVGSP
jgi:glycosyltransferase involved in cell wall biosynthesis